MFYFSHIPHKNIFSIHSFLYFFFVVFVFVTTPCFAQSIVPTNADILPSTKGGTAFVAPTFFQQRADYRIKVRLDDAREMLYGQSEITYTNNSPDTLRRLFLHLYWNAFQKGSAMDFRTHTVQKQGGISRKTMLRIKNLTSEEEGSQRVRNVRVASDRSETRVHGTILEVILKKPIMPHATTLITMDFDAQIPILIRRAGRSEDIKKNPIAYSIAQWYPKICHYDEAGWHPTPYIAREFYGEFGDFSVRIETPSDYFVAASAVLDSTHRADKKTQWYFSSRRVHDFMWAADKGYEYFYDKIPDTDIRLGFFYKARDTGERKQWLFVHDVVTRAYPYIAKIFGTFPYRSYNFIQGGDGGMEYILGTLMASPAPHTALHEWLHSWYQGALASNESAYAWLDEGFTSYAEARISAIVNPTSAQRKNPLFNQKDYDTYVKFIHKTKHARNYIEEPMNTLSDHFETDMAYYIGSYVKGSIFLSQLGYIIGDSLRDEVLRAYFARWAFHHPKPEDFMRVAHDVSQMQLNWYLNYWTTSTKTIDYAIARVRKNADTLRIDLLRKAPIPMPIDLMVYYKNGDKEVHYIPLDLMLGAKRENEYVAARRVVHKAWVWSNEKYVLSLARRGREVKKIVIDPSGRMADVFRKDNVWGKK